MPQLVLACQTPNYTRTVSNKRKDYEKAWAVMVVKWLTFTTI